MQARDRDRGDRDRGGSEFNEKVVYINRVSKVVKGGRRFNFSAVVVVGDGQGNVGAGMGRAKEVPEAIRKASAIARKGMVRIPMQGSTLTHAVLAKFGAAEILLRPAAPGTGIIAGGGVRAIMEVAGVHDVLSKSLGSRNPVNVVRATMEGLKSLRIPADEKERRREAQALPIPPPPRPRRVEPSRPREPRPPRPVESVEGAPAAVAVGSAPASTEPAIPAIVSEPATVAAPAAAPDAAATVVEQPPAVEEATTVEEPAVRDTAAPVVEGEAVEVSGGAAEPPEAALPEAEAGVEEAPVEAITAPEAAAEEPAAEEPVATDEASPAENETAAPAAEETDGNA
jgi:small subunit ribosomal protein S5